MTKNPAAATEDFNAEIGRHQMLAGWNRRGNPPMWPEPKGDFVPAVWHYAEAADLLLRSADHIPAERTERRNLIMVNPSAGNHYPTLKTHVLAYQMVLPGERARTHRHSPHAGRVVLESDGAYTIVNGVRIPMQRGDVVLTPGMHWHGHAHDGTEPAIWVDFLDVPLVQLLEPMFFEPYPGDWQPAERETRDTPLLFPYDVTRERLAAAEPDATGRYGRRIELGDPALPTVGLYMQQLEPGTTTSPFRTSANYQYVVIDGDGSSVIEGVEVSWSRGDTIAAPSWRGQLHRSEHGAVLLAITDEPLQRYCGYLRTEAYEVGSGSGEHRELTASEYRVG
jgi:gentisate 1,2-dioxygenase